MGSRPTTNDVIRLHATINGADEPVRAIERERCQRSCEAWNELIRRFRETVPSPSIGAANASGYHWLEIYCRGCRQVTHFDLRTIKDRFHPAAAIVAVASFMTCSRCGRDAPFPTLRGLQRHPPETATSYHLRRQGERNAT